MEMEKLTELRVCLRDFITKTDVAEYDPAVWVEEHTTRMTSCVDMWLRTYGGTITMSGTPEEGRATVYPGDNTTDPIIDIYWYTKAIRG